MNWQMPTARTIALIIGLSLMAFLVFYIPSCLQKQRAAADQNRVDTAQAGAAQASGNEAAYTQMAVNANEVASEQLGRDNEKEIRNAEGANAVVAAPVRDATIASLCRRAAYRDSPKCRMLNAR